MKQTTFSDEFMGQVLQNLTHAAQAVEKDSRELAERQRLLKENQRILHEGVERYNKDRIAQVKEELALRDLTWCTCCNTVVSSSEAKFQLTQGRESRRWGEGEYYYKNYSMFHRACPACYAAQERKHGYKGEYDTLAQDQARCSVYFVEKREDGYYWLSASYAKLEDTLCILGDIAPQTVEQCAVAWNLAPRVGIVDGAFIVYKPVVSAAPAVA